MRDALNMTYGFGCHCRNCKFVIKGATEDEAWTCEKDILKVGSVNNRSFCSAGIPIYEQEKKTTTCSNVKIAIESMENEILENHPKHASLRIELESGRVLHASFMPGSVMYLRVDTNDGAVYNNVAATQLVTETMGKVKNITMNSWKY